MIYKINTAEEYTEFLEKNKTEFYSLLVQGVQVALENESQKGLVCTVLVNEGRDIYDIFIEKEDWVQSLEKCLEYFSQNNEADLAIDAYQLLQKVLEKEKE